MAVDDIFHLVYSLSFYTKNQLDYNQFSEGNENSRKMLVLKGLKVSVDIELVTKDIWQSFSETVYMFGARSLNILQHLLSNAITDN